MSITCELSNLSSKKAKELSCGEKWLKKPLFFFFLILCGSMVIVVVLMFSRFSRSKEETGSCNEEARVLYKHQNVTRSEIHALVSLFSDSDQVTSFECRKKSSPGMWASYGITCALNMRLEKHQTTESCHSRRVAAKCFIPDGELPWDLNPSDL